jgi:hypothetical protein
MVKQASSLFEAAERSLATYKPMPIRSGKDA